MVIATGWTRRDQERSVWAGSWLPLVRGNDVSPPNFLYPKGRWGPRAVWRLLPVAGLCNGGGDTGEALGSGKTLGPPLLPLLDSPR